VPACALEQCQQVGHAPAHDEVVHGAVHRVARCARFERHLHQALGLGVARFSVVARDGRGGSVTGFKYRCSYGPVLVSDVSEIDFVSNVRHLIAVYEGIESLLVPKDFKA
jgi:hypothetical protein